ncbi:anti-sigma factor [Asticcacaulis sp. YBE204]|uniref:anti-sigma factor family protein n=1 Tax=Asticcacaulis sp. YBE204 TaxID=1282363 RepID=UPI0003C3CBAC|nr:hypothetical protein [Asticcacaulis sp. YBE204]ESQ78390.1 hypothetical protein AEYBE204_14555 [Asticcacaulis sp. YBE204]
MTLPEKIIAYVDGELNDSERAEVEALATGDPDIAAQIEAHRALSARLSTAFGPVADEPVPAGLAALLAAPEEPKADNVVAFAPRKLRPVYMQVAGMAACLVAGVAITLFLTPQGDFRQTHDGLIARGGLDKALSTQLAADVDGPTRIGLTFADKGGSLCRTFATAANEGMACRQDGKWHIEVAARATTRTEFTQAGSPLILQAVDARLEGDVFDADQERSARDSGWK